MGSDFWGFDPPPLTADVPDGSLLLKNTEGCVYDAQHQQTIVTYPVLDDRQSYIHSTQLDVYFREDTVQNLGLYRDDNPAFQTETMSAKHDFWGFDPRPDEPPFPQQFQTSNTRFGESIEGPSFFRAGDTKSVVNPSNMNACRVSSVRNPRNVVSQVARSRKGLKHEQLHEYSKATFSTGPDKRGKRRLDKQVPPSRARFWSIISSQISLIHGDG